MLSLRAGTGVIDIQHTAIQVSDLEATKRFYEDGLGLEYSQDFHTGFLSTFGQPARSLPIFFTVHANVSHDV